MTTTNSMTWNRMNIMMMLMTWKWMNIMMMSMTWKWMNIIWCQWSENGWISWWCLSITIDKQVHLLLCMKPWKRSIPSTLLLKVWTLSFLTSKKSCEHGHKAKEIAGVICWPSPKKLFIIQLVKNTWFVVHWLSVTSLTPFSVL